MLSCTWCQIDALKRSGWKASGAIKCSPSTSSSTLLWKDCQPLSATVYIHMAAPVYRRCSTIFWYMQPSLVLSEEKQTNDLLVVPIPGSVVFKSGSKRQLSSSPRRDWLSELKFELWKFVVSTCDSIRACFGNSAAENDRPDPIDADKHIIFFAKNVPCYHMCLDTDDVYTQCQRVTEDARHKLIYLCGLNWLLVTDTHFGPRLSLLQSPVPWQLHIDVGANLDNSAVAKCVEHSCSGRIS